MLISVPNIAHWTMRLSLLFGFFEYTQRGILDRTHLQFFTKRRFESLIDSVPYGELVEQSASIAPIELLSRESRRNSAFFRIRAFLELRVARTLPGLFAYQHLAWLKKSS